MNRKPDFELAPILLFTYNRVDTLESTFKALAANLWSADSVLYIFSDGYRSEKDQDAVRRVRDFIRSRKGFKEIIVLEAHHNLGLARSIIEGVTRIIRLHKKVIVLEDDLVSSPNFLVYMNKALLFYEQESKVFSISGYSTIIPDRKNRDVYFTRRASSWGWGTWENRWLNVDWEVRDYQSFRVDHLKRRRFNEMGSDLSRMLDRQMQQKINSWAIRWVYAQFNKDLYTVYPTVSKIENMGTSAAATHTHDRVHRFRTTLDLSNREDFNFTPFCTLDDHFLRPFRQQYSIKTRIKYKVLNALSSLKSLMLARF